MYKYFGLVYKDLEDKASERNKHRHFDDPILSFDAPLRRTHAHRYKHKPYIVGN